MQHGINKQLAVILSNQTNACSDAPEPFKEHLRTYEHLTCLKILVQNKLKALAVSYSHIHVTDYMQHAFVVSHCDLEVT